MNHEYSIHNTHYYTHKRTKDSHSGVCTVRGRHCVRAKYTETNRFNPILRLENKTSIFVWIWMSNMSFNFSILTIYFSLFHTTWSKHVPSQPRAHVTFLASNQWLFLMWFNVGVVHCLHPSHCAELRESGNHPSTHWVESGETPFDKLPEHRSTPVGDPVPPVHLVCVSLECGRKLEETPQDYRETGTRNFTVCGIFSCNNSVSILNIAFTFSQMTETCSCF